MSACVRVRVSISLRVSRRAPPYPSNPRSACQSVRVCFAFGCPSVSQCLCLRVYICTNTLCGRTGVYLCDHQPPVPVHLLSTNKTICFLKQIVLLVESDHEPACMMNSARSHHRGFVKFACDTHGHSRMRSREHLHDAYNKHQTVTCTQHVAIHPPISALFNRPQRHAAVGSRW